MRLLVVSTKAPWPPADGGRLLLWLTLEGLAARGIEPVVVAPAPADAGERREAEARLAGLGGLRMVTARPRPWPLALLAAALRGGPATMARHALPAVGRAVREELARARPALVWAQPLQALGNLPAGAGPVVYRPENVESDLWAQLARQRAGSPWAPLLRREARRLARAEGRAVARAALTLALSPEDAAGLAALAAGAGRIEPLPPPFPAALPPGVVPLAGSPALVAFGSPAWGPNRDALAWLREAVWPAVRARVPGARLHLFTGGAGEGEQIEVHPRPAESAEAFAPGSILLLPLRAASGVRVRLLEAWARGVPVVATPEAARGLAAEDGRELLLGSTPAEIAAAVERLAAAPELAARLVAGGRARLAARHDPAALAARLADRLGELAGEGVA
ncbi:MAG: glycosyltransferase [Thermoanaerobaculia bacterium]|nr:glycosyltransferase [Thermoanaerobaculia bacterium]